MKKNYSLLKNKIFSYMLVGAALFTAACNTTKEEVAETDLAKYVDQYIGTGGHGHVFMGANVPFGFVQLGPTSIPQTWDWTSGYHITDTTVIGFSHLHLNGTGIGDLSDIVLMPVVGDVNHNRGTHDSYDTGMWSYFSRANEKCAPGYYATKLDRYNVDVELTATQRVGLHKYTFAEGTTDARIVIDLENGQAWDESVENKLIILNDSTIAGYRYSKGWANDQRVYFVAEFSRPFSKFQLYDKNTTKEGTELVSKQVYGEAIYGEIGTEPIYVKVALSPVSTQNAEINMKAELSGWDFDKVKSQAYDAWNTELAKIKIKTADESVKRIFYTGLYHTMVAPSVFGDVNGDYRGADGNHHIGSSFTNYTTFSLWDTYRAAHPLMTIIHPEKVSDIMNTMLHIYKQQGKLPVWHLMGCETDCMVGNPGIPVVADAILKEFDGFDHELAFEAMKASAMLDDRGMNFRKEFGYIPYDKMLESVAYDMEYALADWSLAQAAKKLGKNEDYDFFEKRSKSYKNFFDPETGFMRGKGVKGEYRTPFSPYASSHREDDYCEGNAWQYTFLVPHDLDGLIECFGSKEAFVQKLDSLFIVDSKIEGDITSPDISGLIGQYAHGNEPSHHILYFYTMVGQPWKGADLIRRVLSELYHDQPDGLSGNEDVGQMSAWYILSSMGLYQVEPAGGHYYFGSPIVDEAVLNVGKGKEFTIVASNNSKENKYIQSVKLNDKPYTLPYIAFEDIQKGGKLEFVMGTEQVAWSN
ncbi:GH92 family glycosyl hydrolase [Dysgonomonas massiliensis]|uniref:GH92 family glycosyl hydrolase n=1 Tax=Dysgonomonas massiliensis TaxID=2040292 RepID=UPI000C78A8BB|nr:GH92 family glycosyl hydrolase [Dysgonomonas massiliensis]